MRSGVYRQTINVLHDGIGYCCLGVACDIFKDYHDTSMFSRSIVTGLIQFISIEGDSLETNATVLPESVWGWFGLDDSSPSIYLETEARDGRTEHTLTELNDGGFTFKQIADLIEYFL